MFSDVRMEVLEDKFVSLSLAGRCVPDDATYLLDVALHPVGAVLAVSCSNSALRLHDEATLRLLGEYRGHGGRVCGLTFAHARPDLLYSASADGTVRAWDVRRPGTDAAQVFRGDPSHSFCSFDLSCGDALLCAGTSLDDEDSLLVFWDSRKPGVAPLGIYSESHSDDITQVRFHPRDKDRLASGSTDGLVNVFDVRRGSEEEALLCTCNSESSAASVRWAAADGSRLLCLSHDEGLHLWDLRQLDTERPLAVFSCPDVRRAEVKPDGRGPEYLVGGAWLEGAGLLLVVGGDRGGDVQLMECDDEGLRLLGTLRGGHASTVRCFVWDEARGALVTGGEDAQLLLWKPGGEEQDAGKKEDRKSSSVFKLKSRPHKKHRYTKKPPY
ncbi:WD repeat-containing protein 89 isoform X2 [Phyllopteryx taeniolatus]|uniref:WD repeat-containing protein 89 isoform X2 n=1 Tax=Phyllopteryx taeniolatus TaxID=161469 RepID=UPI002AD27099|nr:WD repeat-containing protein 89 isoform X2 [Phyllopteryx taeniolatus]